MNNTGKETAMMNEDYLICRNAPPRSLLPDERQGMEGKGKILTLQRDVCVEGIAGTGGVEVDGNHLLGGWCSFGCRLAIPRRFAVKEGWRLAEGEQADHILCETLRSVLNRLFTDQSAQSDHSGARMKKQLGRRFQEEARLALLQVGWQITHCRLEDVQITRRNAI